MMIKHQHNGLTFFQFSHLTPFPWLRHAVFTRAGGYSRGPFEALNVGRNVGDKEALVLENRQLLIDCLGFGRAAFLKQVHGDKVFSFSAADARQVGFGLEKIEADALVTDAAGLLLTIQTADCQAVLLHDPLQRVIANVHAGWRGSAANIIGKTVAVMKNDFFCRPTDLLAAIGPSLGPCCAEFVNYRTELPRFIWKYKRADDHFDFWTLSVDQLKAAGVKGKNIQTSGLCTRCRQDLFFSYRGAKTTGRFATVIGMTQ